MRSKDQELMRDILDFINDYHLDNYTTPTMQEIADKFNLAKSSASRYVAVMRENGMIEHTKGKSGIKTNYYDTFIVNYIANKYITEAYLKKRMDRGGSIVYVTSLGAKHWDKYHSEFTDYNVAKTWTDMVNILHERANENMLGITAYPLSKRALNYYMVEQAIELARRGIRVNSLMPGSTDTNSIKDYAIMAGGVENLMADAGLVGSGLQHRRNQ